MKGEYPSVSIVTPSYNRKELLKETIQSVIYQTYLNWEHIIVDDGSSDDLLEMVSGFHKKESRIRLIQNDTGNKGASVCRNIGWQEAKGEYIIFLDSDDLLAPYCLEQRVKIMEQNPDLDFAVFPLLVFDMEPEKAIYLWNVDKGADDLRRFLRLDAVWQTTGPIWRKLALSKINGFNEKLSCWQDLDLHTRALLAKLRYKKFYDQQPDCYYRRHGNESISQQRINTPEKLQSRALIINSIFNRLKKEDRIIQYSEELKKLFTGLLISSSKTLNSVFFYQWIRSDLSKDILSMRTKIKLLTIWFCYILRLNKVTFVNRIIESSNSKFSFSTSIGKVQR
jgi:glycosyltransferase involved in cell wall biosynthesis